jgi:DNA-binding SARP family transcriptional activator
MEEFVARLVAGAAAAEARVLSLFDEPRLTHCGVDVELPEGTRRIVAFVALHPRGIGRQAAAAALWPGVTAERADGNLRSALWRLRKAAADIVVSDSQRVALSDDVLVDVRIVERWAHRAVNQSLAEDELLIGRICIDMLDLLPGCSDDWVVAERERVRQRLLDGLEALSRQLAQMDRAGEAVNAAMIVVAGDPLRESAQRALIEAHLADGNWNEAYQGFHTYRQRLGRELGVDPHPAVRALLQTRPRNRLRRTEVVPGDVVSTALFRHPST